MPRTYVSEWNFKPCKQKRRSFRYFCVKCSFRRWGLKLLSYNNPPSSNKYHVYLGTSIYTNFHTLPTLVTQFPLPPNPKLVLELTHSCSLVLVLLLLVRTVISITPISITPISIFISVRVRVRQWVSQSFMWSWWWCRCWICTYVCTLDSKACGLYISRYMNDGEDEDEGGKGRGKVSGGSGDTM